MEITWVEGVVSALITSTVVSGLIIWLGKTWIGKQLEYEYSSKLEALKASIKSENDKEIENLKAFLSIESARQNVIFTKLHEQRAEVIAEVYARLIDTTSKLKTYMSAFEPAGIAPKSERRAAFGTAYNNFSEYYHSKAIFLPKDTSEGIAKLQSELKSSGIVFMHAVETPENRDFSKWIEIGEKVENIASSVIPELEAEFRKILGVA